MSTLCTGELKRHNMVKINNKVIKLYRSPQIVFKFGAQSKSIIKSNCWSELSNLMSVLMKLIKCMNLGFIYIFY